jgi:serralysin
MLVNMTTLRRFTALARKNIGLGLALAILLAAIACVAGTDRSVPQRTAKEASSPKTPRMCTQLAADTNRLALPFASKWDQGKTLTVFLINPSPIVGAKVQEKALQWNQYSGVKFQFVSQRPADIRVSFNPDGTSWSYVGTDCVTVPSDQPTMNFGWLTDTTDDGEFSRVVLHEFGHALGCIHEHQNPAAGIPWDKPKVYNYYWQKYRWSRGEVDQNLFRLYDKSITQYTAFDPNSIMLYSIPAELTTTGFSVGWNRVLSETDKEFITKVYPQATPASVPGKGP